MKRLLKLLFALTIFILLRAQQASGMVVNSDFCIVPVADDTTRQADDFQIDYMASPHYDIPGLPSPVFEPVGRRLMIDANRRLIPFPGPFPMGYPVNDNWRLEPWSGRVVAISAGRETPWFLTPGRSHFEPMKEANADIYTSIAVLPKQRTTIITTGAGAPYVVDGIHLRPWKTAELRAQGMSGIYHLGYAPSLSATVILDSDKNIRLRTDDGSWYRVGSSDGDYGDVEDVPGSGVALFQTATRIFAIHRNPFGLSPYAADVLAGGWFHVPLSALKMSKIFQRILVYQSGGLFGWPRRWRHLIRGEMVAIPGGEISNDGSSVTVGAVFDFPTLGRTLIEGANGIFAYDGAKISPLAQGTRDVLGKDFSLTELTDLPSIGHVIASTNRGIFEITLDGVRPLTMPFPTGGFPHPLVADWPAAGIALIATKKGIYALNRDLVATPVLGGDQIGVQYNFALEQMPLSSDFILQDNKKGLFLAVDGRKATGAVCHRQ